MFADVIFPQLLKAEQAMWTFTDIVLTTARQQACSSLAATCAFLAVYVRCHCSQLFTFNNHCSIVVDNHQQAFFTNYCQLMFQQDCNNYCSLSTSNNYWTNNIHRHCEFNKCCWILITTLFRRCSTNNVASTWSIFARLTHIRSQSTATMVWSVKGYDETHPVNIPCGRERKPD